jgi:Tlde1 domain
MTCTAATFPDIRAYNARVLVPDGNRRSFGGVITVLAAVAAVGVMAGTVAVAAAWIVAIAFATNHDLRFGAPVAVETAAWTRPHRRLVDAADAFASTLEFDHTAFAPGRSAVAATATPAPTPWRAIEQANLIPLPLRRPRVPAEQAIAEAVPLPLPRPRVPMEEVAAEAVPLPLRRPRIPVEQAAAEALPLLLLRPPSGGRIAAAQAVATVERRPPPSRARPRLEHLASNENPRRRLADAGPEITGSVPPPASPSSVLSQERVARLPPQDHPLLPGPASHTAVYDIEAHTVYLPGGGTLEAHSGLGRRLDDPRYVADKGRGPTPPNVYDLTLRRQLFHGVQAIRLNPVNDARMFGRDGILAHTYMLGPSGQSFGCVSFRNYPAFLHAFLRGKIDRLVVVRHLTSEPFGAARARSAPSAFTPS